MLAIGQRLRLPPPPVRVARGNTRGCRTSVGQPGARRMFWRPSWCDLISPFMLVISLASGRKNLAAKRAGRPVALEWNPFRTKTLVGPIGCGQFSGRLARFGRTRAGSRAREPADKLVNGRYLRADSANYILKYYDWTRCACRADDGHHQLHGDFVVHLERQQ